VSPRRLQGLGRVAAAGIEVDVVPVEGLAGLPFELGGELPTAEELGAELERFLAERAKPNDPPPS